MRRIVLILVALFMMGSLSLNSSCFVQKSWAQTSETEEMEDEDEEEGFEDDEEGFEDEEEGFGEDEGDGFQEIEIEVPVQASAVDKGYDFGGFIKEDLAYSYQKPDANFKFTRTKAELNKIRLTLNLFYDLKLSESWQAKISGNGFYDAYYDENREDFPNETLEAFEREIELRDTFIEGPITDSIRLKIGRQIIAWGESEGLAITDMANPRDNRELGLVDIEDARIPVFASKLSYLTGNWEWNLVVIHEFRSNKNATAGTDFDPYISLREVFPFKAEELPEEEGEWLFRLFQSFNGGDVSVMFADVYEDSPYLDFEAFTFIPRYKKIQTYGASGNIVRGSWLFKFELAKKLGVTLPREDLEEQLETGQVNPKSWSEKDIFQLMLGFDYSGVTDLSATFEVSVIKIENYEDNLFNEELRAAPSLILRYDTWNNTLHPQFLWVRLPHDNGDLLRLSADYDFIDALQFSGGIAIYDAGRKEDLLYPYRHNDRIFGSAKYSF